MNRLPQRRQDDTIMGRLSRTLGTLDRPFRATAAILALGVSSVTTASAQNTDNVGSGKSQWSLGLGVGYSYRPYRDFDNEPMGIPLISYENRWVSVSSAGADLKLASAGPVSLRLRARYSLDGYESDDSPFLVGMSERKSSLWLGGAAVWRNDIANLSAEVLADAMDNSKGTRAKVQVDHRFPLGSFGVTPRLAAEWVDKKYVDYYYGVRTSEVRADRGYYEGDSTINAEAGLRVDYSPSPRHTLFLDLGATQFGKEIEDSPLLERSNQSSVSLGYIYRF